MTENDHGVDQVGGGEHYWLSVSDMMTGLMIVFLFVAVAYMVHAEEQRKQIKRVAVAYDKSKRDLYHDLAKEFASDLPRWNAEVDSVSLSVRFREPDVLFEAGSASVRDGFQEILREFFPRYVAVVKKYSEYVDELRIEGHTSSEGPSENPYFFNMRLSQDRTRAVLEYCLERTQLDSRDRDWVRKHLTANGLSSSKLILGASGQEDRARSRRVEFRVRTNAEVRMANVLELSK